MILVRNRRGKLKLVDDGILPSTVTFYEYVIIKRDVDVPAGIRGIRCGDKTLDGIKQILKERMAKASKEQKRIQKLVDWVKYLEKRGNDNGW